MIMQQLKGTQGVNTTTNFGSGGPQGLTGRDGSALGNSVERAAGGAQMLIMSDLISSKQGTSSLVGGDGLNYKKNNQSTHLPSQPIGIFKQKKK